MYDDNSPFSSVTGQHRQDPLKPVQKTTFAEERLMQAILWCELAPGVTATEAMIAEHFGLGRAATRVALARLSALGFILPIPREGWRVLPMTGALIGQIVDARRMAEPALARIALDGASAARLFELADMISAVGDQQAARTTRRGYERAFRFELAARLNPFIASFVERLWDHSDRIVCFFEQQGAAAMPALKAGAIAEALQQGRAGDAAALFDTAIDDFRDFSGRALFNNTSELSPEGSSLKPQAATQQQQKDAPAKTGPDRAASREWSTTKGNHS